MSQVSRLQTDLLRTVSKFRWHLFILGMICLTIFVYFNFPVNADPKMFATQPVTGVDWLGTYRPAVWAALQGQNPYLAGLQNPLWIVLLLLPFALLPPGWGAAAMFALTFGLYALVTHRMELRAWEIGVFLLNPMVWACANNGNIDALVVLGLVLPRSVGLFFLLLKPQLMIGVLIFWLVEEFRRGGIKQALRTFAPAGFALLLSFLLYGFWPSLVFAPRLADPFNESFFPRILPLGFTLLAVALRKRDIQPAVASSVFITPYITYHGYAVSLLGLRGWVLVTAVVAIWLSLLTNLIG